MRRKKQFFLCHLPLPLLLQTFSTDAYLFCQWIWVLIIFCLFSASRFLSHHTLSFWWNLLFPSSSASGLKTFFLFLYFIWLSRCEESSKTTAIALSSSWRIEWINIILERLHHLQVPWLWKDLHCIHHHSHWHQDCIHLRSIIITRCHPLPFMVLPLLSLSISLVVPCPTPTHLTRFTYTSEGVMGLGLSTPSQAYLFQER